ncbi:GNAT family N-acetyltransferase [Halomicronema sp. CCY15110]|uniref:GNAT family N-acetyltransferase n=1 Tax=Halomicronema sp. CCY15110 TaxID=2767773 RepID=UPI001951376A|nr:GNAT family N-acetyltransferase [Halomicronema sp. CCY15110]
MTDHSAQLRPTTPANLEFVLSAEATAHASGFVQLWTRDRHLQTLDDPNAGHWIIEDTTTHKRVGYVILLGLQDPHQCLLLKRIVITQTGKGYGRSVLMQVLDKAFNEFAAHRIWLDVMEDNHRARSLYRSLGFVEEGCLRESVKMGEQFKSQWLMSMLRSEFVARSSP